jgi:hypothetical protein
MNLYLYLVINKIEVGKQVDNTFGLSCEMLAYQHYTMDSFLFENIIKDWNDNKVMHVVKSYMFDM